MLPSGQPVSSTLGHVQARANLSARAMAAISHAAEIQEISATFSCKRLPNMLVGAARKNWL